MDTHRYSLELPELVKDVLLDGLLQHLDSGWYTVSPYSLNPLGIIDGFCLVPVFIQGV